jgi:glycosyltransferase involved in cell wall biosynthesis
MTAVSVLVPTFRRPNSFVRAARSVFSQRSGAQIELVAVDNSPEGSARDVCRMLESQAPFVFRWTHEAAPGVARARNAALAQARGDMVAWLDDDQEAPADWLDALIAAQRETGAESVFGPVRARAAPSARNAAFYERLHSRSGPATNGLIKRAFGLGNSLQPRALFAGPAPFDERANERGGEDDMLFAAWAAAGARFAWAADAPVIEHLGPERVRLAYALRRAFAFGQGPCELAWARRDHAALLRHMSVGAAQALACGALSAPALVLSTPHGLALLGAAARGAGKLAWFVEQRFYGETLARQTA